MWHAKCFRCIGKLVSVRVAPKVSPPGNSVCSTTLWKRPLAATFRWTSLSRLLRAVSYSYYRAFRFLFSRHVTPDGPYKAKIRSAPDKTMFRIINRLRWVMSLPTNAPQITYGRRPFRRARKTPFLLSFPTAILHNLPCTQCIHESRAAVLIDSRQNSHTTRLLRFIMPSTI